MYHNLHGKLKEYFKFSKDEINDLIKISLLFGFMLSFADWGIEQFSAASGIYAWIISALLLFSLYSIYLAIIKAISVHQGYVAEFKMGKYLWAFALYFTFLTEGYNSVILLIPGAIHFSVIKKLRLGKLSAGADYNEFGYIGVEAGLIMIMFGSLFAPLYGLNLVFDKIFIISMLIALFSMLPFPYTTGFYLLTTSYLAFISLLTLIFIAVLLASFNIGTFYTLIIAGICAIIAWIIAFQKGY